MTVLDLTEAIAVAEANVIAYASHDPHALLPSVENDVRIVAPIIAAEVERRVRETIAVSIATLPAFEQLGPNGEWVISKADAVAIARGGAA